MSKSKSAAAPEPAMINDNNLSRAWSRLILGILEGAGTEVSPLVLSLSGFDEQGNVAEDPAVRHALDELLRRQPCPPFRALSRDVPALAGHEQKSQWPRPVF
jgi:hypothetical protein